MSATEVDIEKVAHKICEDGIEKESLVSLAVESGTDLPSAEVKNISSSEDDQDQKVETESGEIFRERGQ